MRQKQLKLIITFHTTTCAMAMEKQCRLNDIRGRIIPVPRAISAGCGLAWMAEIEDEAMLIAQMEASDIAYSAIQECLI